MPGAQGQCLVFLVDDPSLRVSTHVAIIVTDEQTCFLAASRRVSDVTVTSEKIEENVQ